MRLFFESIKRRLLDEKRLQMHSDVDYRFDKHYVAFPFHAIS